MVSYLNTDTIEFLFKKYASLINPRICTFYIYFVFAKLN